MGVAVKTRRDQPGHQRRVLRLVRPRLLGDRRQGAIRRVQVEPLVFARGILIPRGAVPLPFRLVHPVRSHLPERIRVRPGIVVPGRT